MKFKSPQVQLQLSARADTLDFKSTLLTNYPDRKVINIGFNSNSNP